MNQLEEIDGRCRQLVPHRVRLSPRYYDAIPFRQLYRLRNAFHLEPACPLVDDVEHSAVSGNANAPRGAELRPEIDAALKTNTTKEIIKQRLTPVCDSGLP